MRKAVTTELDNLSTADDVAKASFMNVLKLNGAINSLFK